MNTFYRIYCIVVVLSACTFGAMAGRWLRVTPHGDPLPILRAAIACLVFYLVGILVAFIHQVIDARRKP